MVWFEWNGTSCIPLRCVRSGDRSDAVDGGKRRLDDHIQDNEIIEVIGSLAWIRESVVKAGRCYFGLSYLSLRGREIKTW